MSWYDINTLRGLSIEKIKEPIPDRLDKFIKSIKSDLTLTVNKLPSK